MRAFTSSSQQREGHANLPDGRSTGGERGTPLQLLPRQPKRPVRTDDNVGRGMDLALVTLLFLGAGYGLDRLFGTRPVLMIVFVVISLVGQFARMWFDYERKMTQLEAERADVHRRSAP